MNRATSILPDLTEVRIPEAVKIEANLVYQSLNITTKRKNNRQRMIFFCVYVAFLNLGLTEEPRVIAELVSLPKNEIPKSFSLCSELETGLSLPVRQKEAGDFFPVILRDLGIDISVEELEDILSYVVEKDPSLNDCFPQVLAAGIISFYLDINGLSSLKNEIPKIIRRSPMSCAKVSKAVSKAYNI